MAIRLISAVLVEAQAIAPDGRYVLVEPHAGPTFPASARPNFLASGKKQIVASIPDWVVFLLLYGGEVGQAVKLTAALSSPSTETLSVGIDEFKWEEGASFRYSLKLEGQFTFVGSAIYELRILANGEPIGILPIAITWDDETAR